MRFISHIRKFGVGIFGRQAEILGGGVERELRPGLVAQFRAHDLTREDMLVAERHWHRVHGRTLETDQVTPTDLKGRMSTYDTEDEANLREYHRIDLLMKGKPTPDGLETWEEGTTKRLVEEKLTAKATGEMFARIEEIPAEAPWPRFNEFPGGPEDLVQVLIVQGHSLPHALTFERQNLNRPEVVEALEAAIAGETPAAPQSAGEFIPA